MPSKTKKKKPQLNKTPYWNRDEKEYENLNIIQANIRAYSLMLRGWSNGRGGRLNIKGWVSALRLYSGSIWSYFKWLKPYLKDNNRIDEMDKTLSLLEISDVWIKNADRLVAHNQFPAYYKKAFDVLEEVEQMLNEYKIEMGMGVRLENQKQRTETLSDRYVERSMKT